MLMDYLALAEGLSSRKLIPATENVLNIVRKNPTKDYYTSLYTYQDKHLEQFKRTNSLSGITDVKTNRLFFDFDSQGNAEAAQKDAAEVFDRLIESGVSEDSIQIWFSGNKGVHLEIPLNESLSRQEFVNIVFGLADGLKTFDVRINDEARIIRSPFSKHPVSKLYKIPITAGELKSLPIAAIKEFAKDLNSFDLDGFVAPVPIALTDSLNVLKSQIYKKINAPLAAMDIKGFDTKDLDLSICPAWMSTDRFALSQGFFYGSDSVNVGERNIAFMILASTYRSQGFDADQTAALLETTAKKQSLRTGEEEYDAGRIQREVINSVFSSNWRGGIYSSDEPLLQRTRERFNITEEVITTAIEDINIVGDGFKNFAKNLSKNRIKVGLKSLDETLMLTTGMLCTAVSAPGGGKTALANLFAETVSKENENVLYFSLDLYKNLLFGRMLQRHIPYDIKSILSQFESGDVDDKLIEAYTQVLANYTNVGFSFKSSSIDDIEREVAQNARTKGKTPKLVIVDYLDKVKSPYTDPTQSSAFVAGRLSDIAKKYETLVLLLAQPSKFGSSGPDQEFTSYRALKGSSSIESDSRVVLGIHRPGYSAADQTNDNFSSITILKNNTGPLKRLDYAWNGISGTFNELDYGQKKILKELRDRLEKKNQDSRFD